METTVAAHLGRMSQLWEAMTMPRLAAHLFELLYEQGVRHAFGLPGDFALTLFDALAESPLEIVVMTHEPCVGFAADAYSRVRGLGVAVVTYGVGALNMVTRSPKPTPKNRPSSSSAADRAFGSDGSMSCCIIKSRPLRASGASIRK